MVNIVIWVAEVRGICRRMMKVVEDESHISSVVPDGRAAFGYDALLDRQEPDLTVQLWQQRE